MDTHAPFQMFISDSRITSDVCMYARAYIHRVFRVSRFLNSEQKELLGQCVYTSLLNPYAIENAPGTPWAGSLTFPQ